MRGCVAAAKVVGRQDRFVMNLGETHFGFVAARRP
jgi:hypothetical protein